MLTAGSGDDDSIEILREQLVKIADDPGARRPCFDRSNGHLRRIRRGVQDSNNVGAALGCYRAQTIQADPADTGESHSWKACWRIH
jgi:hypothetical protein